ncbi:MAG: sulfite exporter TauE/SafE family protein, partial [Chloroflexi bacterium]|nr:sulfite exporter TauE/SafE family protein [Chloroflexota bacterium]
GHPALLEAARASDEVPDNAISFFVTENIHDQDFLLEKPVVYLSIDGSPRLDPIGAFQTRTAIHHRTNRFDFALPAEFTAATFNDEDHMLTLVVDTGDGIATSANTLTWSLPANLPGVSAAAEAAPAATDAEAAIAAVEQPAVPVYNLSQALRRSKKNVAYGGVDTAEITATFATREYFLSSFPTGAVERYMPENQVVFVFSESTHTESLPDEPPTLGLRIDGREYASDFTERKVTSPHHRVTIIRFDTEPDAMDTAAKMELLLPDGKTVQWDLPISYAGSNTPFGMSWATLLALLAGMLASMWPCLFQLTAYFIPALAGLSMEQADGKVHVSQRFAVLKAALFFVLGFTLVYTAAGAALGYAAGQLGESTAYESAQRWVAFGAGIIVLFLALRVAAKVRAPLVCKMPILSRMGNDKNKGGAKPWEMMLAGLAFATGCMTCFGSALVIGMVVYVGMAQSALYGALILLIFSLGMGIPLVIAGVMMAKVLPLLFKMEKMVKWMGVASAMLMTAFGILLISGNYMAFAELVYGLTGSPLAR